MKLRKLSNNSIIDVNDTLAASLIKSKKFVDANEPIELTKAEAIDFIEAKIKELDLREREIERREQELLSNQIKTQNGNTTQEIGDSELGSPERRKRSVGRGKSGE